MKSVSVSTKPIITKVEGVNRLIFHIFFPIKGRIKGDLNKNMLSRLLNVSSKKYNKPGDVQKVRDSLYLSSYDCGYDITENYVLYDFFLCVPREGIIDEFSLDKALEFFHEMIFNPCVDGNKFDEKVFNYERDFLLEKEKDFPVNINQFAFNEYSKFIDPNEENELFQETYVKNLKSLTPEGVYDYYKKGIKDNPFYTYIYGAVDDEEYILNTFNKYFKQEEKTLTGDLEFFNIMKPSEYEEKEIVKDYNQSMLFLHYNIKDYTSDEYLKLVLLSSLLDSEENNLIYKKLRHDNNLIYTCNIRRNVLCGTYDVIVYLEYEDIPTVKKLINEVFESIKDKEFFEECKERTLKAMKYFLLELEDNPLNEAYTEMKYRFSYDVKPKERIEKLKDISYEDIMDLISRMVNTKTMIIKGDKNE